jgi:hypothetical protein
MADHEEPLSGDDHDDGGLHGEGVDGAHDDGGHEIHQPNTRKRRSSAAHVSVGDVEKKPRYARDHLLHHHHISHITQRLEPINLVGSSNSSSACN